MIVSAVVVSIIVVVVLFLECMLLDKIFRGDIIWELLILYVSAFYVIWLVSIAVYKIQKIYESRREKV